MMEEEIPERPPIPKELMDRIIAGRERRSAYARWFTKKVTGKEIWDGDPAPPTQEKEDE